MPRYALSCTLARATGGSHRASCLPSRTRSYRPDDDAAALERHTLIQGALAALDEMKIRTAYRTANFRDGQGAMSELKLQEAPGSRTNNFQVLDEAGRIIGYIVLLTALAGTHAKPWMWSIDFSLHEGRDQTHGFEATREAAMEAFTRCWFREV